jgi:hypothetical protein
MQDNALRLGDITSESPTRAKVFALVGLKFYNTYSHRALRCADAQRLVVLNITWVKVYNNSLFNLLCTKA